MLSTILSWNNYPFWGNQTIITNHTILWQVWRISRNNIFCAWSFGWCHIIQPLRCWMSWRRRKLWRAQRPFWISNWMIWPQWNLASQSSWSWISLWIALFAMQASWHHPSMLSPSRAWKVSLLPTLWVIFFWAIFCCPSWRKLLRHKVRLELWCLVPLRVNVVGMWIWRRQCQVQQISTQILVTIPLPSALIWFMPGACNDNAPRIRSMCVPYILVLLTQALERTTLDLRLRFTVVRRSNIVTRIFLKEQPLLCTAHWVHRFRRKFRRVSGGFITANLRNLLVLQGSVTKTSRTNWRRSAGNLSNHMLEKHFPFEGEFLLIAV